MHQSELKGAPLCHAVARLLSMASAAYQTSRFASPAQPSQTLDAEAVPVSAALTPSGVHNCSSANELQPIPVLETRTDLTE